MKHTKETEQAVLRYSLRYGLNIVRYACKYLNQNMLEFQIIKENYHIYLRQN